MPAPRRWGQLGFCEGRPQPGRGISGKSKNLHWVRGKVWGMSLEWGEKCQECPWEWLCWIPWQPAQSKSPRQPAAEAVLKQAAFPEGTRQRRGTAGHGEPTMEQQRGWNELSTAHIPPPFGPAQGAGRGGGTGNRGMKLSLQKTGHKGKVFRFYLCFSSFKTILIGNKLIFPELGLFCHWWQLVSDVSLSLSQPTRFFIPFSPILWGAECQSGWLGTQPAQVIREGQGRGRALDGNWPGLLHAGLRAAWNPHTALTLLCSHGSSTGNSLPAQSISSICGYKPAKAKVHLNCCQHQLWSFMLTFTTLTIQDWRYGWRRDRSHTEHWVNNS